MSRILQASVSYEKMIVSVNFVVQNDVSSDLVFERFTLQLLEGVLECRSEEARLDNSGKEPTLLMVLVFSQLRFSLNRMDSKNIMSHSADDESVLDGKGGNEELIMTFRCESLSEQNNGVHSNATDREEQVCCETMDTIERLPRHHFTEM